MIDYKKIKKILICRLSSLGDILLTTPLVDSIKKQNQKIDIDFILKENYSDVIKFNPNIRKVILYHPDKVSELRNEIITENYDLIIDLQNNLRTNLLFAFNGIKKTHIKKSRLKKLLLVHLKINRFESNFSIPQLYADTADITLSTSARLSFYSMSSKVLRDEKRNSIIGFCPGAKHFTKKWSEDQFAELGLMLNKSGFQIYLFGGKLEKNLCKRLSEKIPNAVDFSTENDLIKTAETMQLCDLVVSNDSALMHLASAINIPIVAIFGSSVKEFGFTPFNVDYKIIENSNLQCRPCSHIGRSNCLEKHFKCMLEIKPQHVYKEISRMLKIDG